MIKKLLFFVLLLTNLHILSAQKNDKLLYELLTKVNKNYMQNDVKAQKTLDSIQPILKKRANDSLFGLFYRVQSNIKSNQLDKNSALRFINQSINYYSKAKNNKGITLSMLNKGNNYFQRGDTKNAMQIYTNALSIAKKNGLEVEAAILIKNIGFVFFNQEKVDVALQYYNQALTVFLKYNDKKNTAATYINIGHCYYEKFNDDKALLYFKKAVTLSNEVNDTVTIAKLYNNIGAVYIDDKKDTIAGLNYLLKAIDLKEKLNDQDGLLFQYNNVANVYISLKNYDLGEKYLSKSFIMAKKAENKEQLKEIYEMYALLYKGKGDFEKAYQYQVKFAKAKDTLLNIENLKAVQEIQTKYQTAAKEKQLLQKETEIKNSRNKLIVVSLLTMFSILIGFLIYRQQKLKNKQQEQEFELQSAISQIETQNKLHEQRLSISRDLHDNIGAQLTFIISSVDNLKFANAITDSKISNQLNKISDFTKDTIIELRDTIWAMNTNEFTFEDLRSRIFNFIEKAKAAKENIVFKFTIDEKLKDIKLSSLVGLNLYRTIQETINNSVKHSDGNQISVEVSESNDQIKIEISDNGKGFDIETIEIGNGLHNMEKRIEEVKGSFQIHSEPNKGTKTVVFLPKKI
jgi:signal transduction histidine kinase/tetratricopeptide (TPR) repeat protein